MQLVVKYAADTYGGPHDLVVASYDDDAIVPLDQFPGAKLVPFSGAIEELERIGPDPDPAAVTSGLPDMRPHLAPAVDLVAYAASVRFYREDARVSVSIGGETVPMGTAKPYRDGYRDTLLGILAGVREDGATFKFADGVSRPATNSEVQTGIAKVFAYVQALFDVECNIQKDRAKAKPTIKTAAAVDAAFAAVIA